MSALVTRDFIKQLLYIIFIILVLLYTLKCAYPKTYERLFSKYSLKIEPFTNKNNKKIEKFWKEILN